MDYEGYLLMHFVNSCYVLTNGVLVEIHSCEIDLKNQERKITYPLDNKSYETDFIPVLDKLESLPKLIDALKGYKKYLEASTLKPLERERKQLIQKIENTINKLTDKTIAYYNFDFCQTNVVSSLYELFIDLNMETVKFLVKIKTHMDSKFIHLSELNELFYPTFNEDLKTIYELYDSLLKSHNKENATEFLNSSKYSFINAQIQFNQISYATLNVMTDIKESKDTLYSHLTSSLFLFLSAYEKIIYSISYNLENNEPFDKISYWGALTFIKTKNNILFDTLIRSDRTDTLKVATNLRNSDTHRLSNFAMDEIKGYILSVIKETKRILEIYNENSIKNKPNSHP